MKPTLLTVVPCTLIVLGVFWFSSHGDDDNTQAPAGDHTTDERERVRAMDIEADRVQREIASQDNKEPTESEPVAPSAPPDSSSAVDVTPAPDETLPPELQQDLFEHDGRRYMFGLWARSFVENPTSMTATTLLAQGIALRLDCVGAALLPGPDYDPKKSNAENGFPPALDGDLVLAVGDRRYHFLPQEFPLYANALARNQEERSGERTAWTGEEVAEVIHFAAESIRMATGD